MAARTGAARLSQVKRAFSGRRGFRPHFTGAMLLSYSGSSARLYFHFFRGGGGRFLFSFGGATGRPSNGLDGFGSSSVLFRGEDDLCRRPAPMYYDGGARVRLHRRARPCGGVSTVLRFTRLVVRGESTGVVLRAARGRTSGSGGGQRLPRERRGAADGRSRRVRSTRGSVTSRRTLGGFDA